MLESTSFRPPAASMLTLAVNQSLALPGRKWAPVAGPLCPPVSACSITFCLPRVDEFPLGVMFEGKYLGWPCFAISGFLPVAPLHQST